MYYLISDQHFGTSFESDTHKFRDFTLFAKYLLTRRRAQLIILGDFFDFWYEKNGRIRGQYKSLVALLAHLIENGVGVTYLRGNHDFMPMKSLQKAGCRVQQELELHHGGRRVYLAHGHLCRAGLIKRVVYRGLENPFLQWLYGILPFDRAVDLASRVALKSRVAGEAACEDHNSRYYSLLSPGSGDILVLGHTHTAALKSIGPEIYVNTGTWLNGARPVAVLDDTAVALCRFSPRRGGVLTDEKRISIQS
ncbi:MAG: UDP-2,3-diacylglucosamine diphosphatase [Fibrobacterota bacterium]